MSGFASITGQPDYVYSDNASFDGTTRGGGLVSNGQLWIGSTALPNVRVGNITSTDGTVTITNSAGNIDLSLAGGGVAIDSIGVQSGVNPIAPTAAGLVTINATSVVAGTNPVITRGTGANTMSVDVQISQAIAATDATKIGLCNFNSAYFSVDANGFVSSVGGGGFTWTDVTGATQTIAVQNGYLTDRGGGVVYTLPATASIGDTFKVVGKAGLATITPNANQQLLIASSSGTVGAVGTAVSTNAGDCITFVCTTSGASTVYRAESVVGSWTLN